MDAMSCLGANPSQVDGLDGLAAAKEKTNRFENDEAPAIFRGVDSASQVKASVENGDLEDTDKPNHAEDPKELRFIGQAELSYGVEDQDNVDETVQVAVSNGIEEPGHLVDADVIKDEQDADAYPDYDMIKKEEPDDDQIDKKLPELGEINDMFDDVDAPEYVDLDYEGIAEVDGVDCFVCEGQQNRLSLWTCSNPGVEFKIRQVPKPVIVTRPLYQLFGQSYLRNTTKYFFTEQPRLHR